MLGAGHHVALHPACQRGAQGAQMVRIFAIGFLGAAPCRMAQQVDADAAEVIAAQGAHFAPDDVADSLFELRIEGGAPRHGDWKGGSALQE